MLKLRPRVSLLISAFALLTTSPATEAGSYDVGSCGAVAGAHESWVYETNALGSIQFPDECASPGTDYSGLYVRTILGGAAPATGAYGQWRIAAPSGATITHIRISRWLGMEAGSGWRPFGRQADGTIVPGETCSTVSGEDECNVGLSSIDRALSTSSLAYGIECVSVNGCTTGATIHDARAVIESATVTITDNVAPTVTPPTGPLVTESGFHHGTEAASFTGADVTGLQAVRVYVDGILRASATPGQPGWAACAYTRVVPCENPAGDRTLTVDTTALADGQHQVEVAAVDAAGNETVALPRAIVVDNTAPAAPPRLSTSAGADWQSSPTFAATWTNPGDQVAPITTAHWTLCPRNGATACTSGQAPGQGGIIGGLHVPGDGEWDMAIALEDEAGNITAASGRAVATIRYDGTAPAAPHGLSIASRAPSDPAATATWTHPADPGAPLSAALWTLCPRDSAAGCSSGSGAAYGPLSVRLPAEGDWTLSVALRDHAGHTGPAATTSIGYAHPPAPPPPVPADPPLAEPATAKLTIAKPMLDRSRRRVTVRGTIARGAVGRVRLTARYRVGTRGRTETLRSSIRNGRFTARFRLSHRHAARARSVRVTARFTGSPGYRPAISRRNASIRR